MTQLLHQVPLHTHYFVDSLKHMHGNTDCPRLIGNGAADSLTNPPGCVSAEFVPLRVIKFLHCPQQTHVPFLHQIKQMNTPAHIPLGNTHHQAQIRPRQIHFRFFRQVVNEKLIDFQCNIGIS